MRLGKLTSHDFSQDRPGEGTPSPVILLTGLSGAGKTTLCRALACQLRDRHWLVAVIDGDDLRRTVCADLGFKRKDREENLRRIGQIANHLSSHCDVVLIAAIAPYRQSRGELRHSIPKYLEVFVNAPLEVCIRRDPKGLYRKALAGEIPRFTGVGDGYESPIAPDIECNTDRETIQASVDKIVQRLISFCNSRNHEVASHE